MSNFCVTTNDISSGTGGAESAQVLIQNPPLSKKVMKIYRFTLGTNVSTNNNIFRLYLNPTITSAGTPLPTQRIYMDGTGTPSIALVSKVPVVSSNGGLAANFIAGPTTSVNVDMRPLLVVYPGQNLLWTVRPNAGSTTYSFNAFWLEESLPT